MNVHADGARVLFCLSLAFIGCSGGGPADLPDDGIVSDVPAIDSLMADADAASDDAVDPRDSTSDASDLIPTDQYVTDSPSLDAEVAVLDVPDPDAPVADVIQDTGPTVYPPAYCAYFLTGEVDLYLTDDDGDGVSNGFDHCPNNPYDWYDSDRDGIGNKSDDDLDGDGLPNASDPDIDDDLYDNTAEAAAGTDPADPSSIPGLRRDDTDLGAFNRGPGWYLGDLHVHTQYSHDGIAPISTFFGAADGAGLDFLAITDHDLFEAPFDPAWDQDDLLLIPGMEWGGAGGHANQWGIRTWNDAATNAPDDIRKSWRIARLQGGVQSINHYGADKDTWDALFAEAPDLLDKLDVVEIWNLVWAFTTGTNEPSVELWERLLSEGKHVGAVGGGDSHAPVATLGSPTTAVWAESLTVPGILHGIRMGRTYITQADALTFNGRPELDFRVDADGDGVFEAMLGDEVRAGPITIQVNVVNAKGPVVVIRNGSEIKRFSDHDSGDTIAHTFTDTAPAGAWYRVEMRESGLSFAPMRLMSSAIYVAK